MEGCVAVFIAFNKQKNNTREKWNGDEIAGSDALAYGLLG